MRRDVRLLIVGDGKFRTFIHIIVLIFPIKIYAEGVGKSTIITSLLTESFTENVSEFHGETAHLIIVP